MAEVRKSAKQTEARRRAREKAAEFRARQDKLEQLAVDYFVAADSLDEIDAAAEKEIAAVRARAEKQSAEARASAEDVMQRMLALGITRAEVAERLGVSVRDVKKAPTGNGRTASPPSRRRGPRMTRPRPMGRSRRTSTSTRKNTHTRSKR